MTLLYSVQTRLPAHRYTQEEITLEFIKRTTGELVNPKLSQRFHKSVQVGSRCLALPMENYGQLSNFTESNHAFREVALSLGESCVRDLLKKSNLEATDIDQIIFTTVTGLCVPSIDACLVNRIGFRDDIKRVPLFGLGCLAGAAGLSRAHDYLLGHPKDTVILLAIELCSLTVQKDDLSLANLVASGLFGDGAAAVLLLGSERIEAKNCTRILATESAFFKNTEQVMGWDIGHKGFKIVLSAEVPMVAEKKMPPVIDAFLEKQGLNRQDITHWVAHPGGPKVIDALERGLELPHGTLDLSRQSLAEIGNLSSVSVLMILEKTLEINKPKPGDLGLLMAMGPGFCAELVLLKFV
ncbi:MAG: 3-oxoacyl-[acyl-carrier-protein] synthase III C-terminal domain-containing protein [Myxococcaceae bacterium]